jgi:hypothetical protein
LDVRTDVVLCAQIVDTKTGPSDFNVSGGSKPSAVVRLQFLRSIFPRWTSKRTPLDVKLVSYCDKSFRHVRKNGKFGFQDIPLQGFAGRYYLLNIRYIERKKKEAAGQLRWTSRFPSWTPTRFQAGHPEKELALADSLEIINRDLIATSVVMLGRAWVSMAGHALCGFYHTFPENS